MFCSKCRKDVSEGAKFYPYCGKPISQLQREEKPKQRKNIMFLIIPVVELLVISAGVFAYFTFFPRINPEKSSEYEDKDLTALSGVVTRNKITDDKMLKEAENNFKKAVKLDPNNISAKKTSCMYNSSLMSILAMGTLYEMFSAKRIRRIVKC